MKLEFVSADDPNDLKWSLSLQMIEVDSHPCKTNVHLQVASLEPRSRNVERMLTDVAFSQCRL